MRKFQETILLILVSTLLMACQARHQYENIIAPTNSIIGGYRENKDFLFQATVKIKIENNHFCTGLYIGKRTVLTAAHCFGNLALEDRTFKARTVIFYKSNSGMDIDTVCNVERQQTPTRFDSRLYWLNDIAALTLESGCNLSGKVPFIFPVDIIPKDLIFLSGFGANSINNPGFDGSPLRTLEVPAVQKITRREQLEDLADAISQGHPADEETQKWLLGMSNRINNNELYCYSTDSSSHTPFLGDSGGPLYNIDHENLVMYGLFSHFYYASNPKRVVMFCYTPLSIYRDWIETQFATEDE